MIRERKSPAMLRLIILTAILLDHILQFISSKILQIKQTGRHLKHEEEPHLVQENILWEFSNFWADVGVQHLKIIEFSDSCHSKLIWAYHTIGMYTTLGSYSLLCNSCFSILLGFSVPQIRVFWLLPNPWTWTMDSLNFDVVKETGIRRHVMHRNLREGKFLRIILSL